VIVGSILGRDAYRLCELPTTLGANNDIIEPITERGLKVGLIVT
jgi:hypothetical protein